MTDTASGISAAAAAPAGRGAAWLFEGFSMFQKDWLTWIGITVIFFVLSIVVNLIPLGGILFNLVIFAFIGGLMLGCREIDRGGDFRVSHLFAGFSDNLGQYLLLGVLYSAGMLVIVILMLIMMFVMLGGFGFLADIQSGQLDNLLQYSATILIAALVALLLFVPLIMAFWFAPVLVALGNLDAIEAVKKSFSGCLSNVVPYLLYGVIALLLSLLASIPIFLGWLILCPMLVASIYISYRDIFESGNNPQLTTNH
jgi:hypothetical protein